MCSTVALVFVLMQPVASITLQFFPKFEALPFSRFGMFDVFHRGFGVRSHAARRQHYAAVLPKIRGIAFLPLRDVRCVPPWLWCSFSCSPSPALRCSSSQNSRHCLSPASGCSMCSTVALVFVLMQPVASITLQ